MPGLVQTTLSVWAVTMLVLASPSWAQSLPEVVDEFSARLEGQGLEITATIDHAGNASSVGLELRPTTVIFARDRRMEAQLIMRSQTVAIDLPFKFLFWEDEAGNIQEETNGVGYLVDRHHISLRDGLLEQVAELNAQEGGGRHGLVTIDSGQSFETTVAALSASLAGAGFRIPFVFDYRADAAAVGGHVRPTTLIVFGNPEVGTQLMQNRQEIGIDLPQKFLIWEDENGQIHISWNDPFFIARRAGIQGLDALLTNIANALANLAASGQGL